MKNVYIHFPSNLTEEELMLQAKYAKLKKKKKALQILKTPKQEPEKPNISKRPADARDAREVARKLLKSGAIQAIQKVIPKQDQMSFKRPKGQERKKVQQDMNVASYQPFSATQTDTGSNTPFTGSRPVTPEKETPRIQNLYDHFTAESDKEEKPSKDKEDSPTGKDKPKTRSTIYVSGNKVSEEFLRTQFSQFGTITNVSMEIEKGRGFVTFSKTESADKAISECHSKVVAGISLQVQLARHQPQIDPINDASSSAVWATLAAINSQKGSHKDKREKVYYGDDLFG